MHMTWSMVICHGGPYISHRLLTLLLCHYSFMQGSGVNQIACTGATIDPEFSSSLQVYDPATATPPFLLITKSDPACATFCLQSKGCDAAPQIANACEYYYSYGDGSYLHGRPYSTFMSFSPSLAPSSSTNNISGFIVGERVGQMLYIWAVQHTGSGRDNDR